MHWEPNYALVLGTLVYMVENTYSYKKNNTDKPYQIVISVIQPLANRTFSHLFFNSHPPPTSHLPVVMPPAIQPLLSG
jgi:hypothetical protein